MDSKVEGASPSAIDNDISRLDDAIKNTKKAINCLTERLGSVLSPPNPPPEAAQGEPRVADCSLGGRIIAMQHIAEESLLELANIAERLQI